MKYITSAFHLRYSNYKQSSNHQTLFCLSLEVNKTINAACHVKPVSPEDF